MGAIGTFLASVFHLPTVFPRSHKRGDLREHSGSTFDKEIHMKMIFIFATALLMSACASSPTQASTRVIGSSSTNYTTLARIGCLDHLPMEEAIRYRSHVEITKYEDRSMVCVRYDGNEERCYEASVPYDDHGVREVYSTADGDTLTLDMASFMVTGGMGCFMLGRENASP
jgi:hypothetical protein